MEEESLRAILAANVRRMIERAAPLGSRPSVRAWAMGKGLEVRLIDRITKGEHAVTLDTIESIAQACGLQPWQLLLPHLDPDEPADVPITPEDREMLRKLRKLLNG